MCPGTLPPVRNYEDYVGRWLNRTDMLNQQIYVGMVSRMLAMGLDDIPAGVFLAVYDDEESAFEAMVAVNSARSDAKAMRAQAGHVKTRSLF